MTHRVLVLGWTEPTALRFVVDPTLPSGGLATNVNARRARGIHSVIEKGPAPLLLELLPSLPHRKVALMPAPRHPDEGQPPAEFIYEYPKEVIEACFGPSIMIES